MFWAALAFNLGLAGLSYAKMPATVASHFGAAGTPNGWMPKEGLVAVHAASVVFLAFAMLVAGRAPESLPPERINLPNKAYWLSPERRAGTFAWMRGAFEWFGAATFALFLDLFAQVLRMNLGLTRGPEHPRLSLGLYLAFTAVWVGAFFRRFARTA